MTRSTGRSQLVRLRGEIVAYESVKVPAGEFMAYRMILSLDGQRWAERWWTPETRTAARVIMGDLTMELVDYQKSGDPSGALEER